MLAPASANAATTAACTGGVALTQFAFNPASVPAGSSSQLTLVLQNCTNQAITGSTEWYGYYLDANGNEQCGVIDPVAFNYSIAAGGTYTLTNTYGSPPGGQCQPAAIFPGDQKITSAWNATVSQTGENVSATNESYNATIPPGGSQSFGFQGTWTSSDAAPLVFFVNGTVCN